MYDAIVIWDMPSYSANERSCVTASKPCILGPTLVGGLMKSFKSLDIELVRVRVKRYMVFGMLFLLVVALWARISGVVFLQIRLQMLFLYIIEK